MYVAYPVFASFVTTYSTAWMVGTCSSRMHLLVLSRLHLELSKKLGFRAARVAAEFLSMGILLGVVKTVLHRRHEVECGGKTGQTQQ